MFAVRTALPFDVRTRRMPVVPWSGEVVVGGDSGTKCSSQSQSWADAFSDDTSPKMPEGRASFPPPPRMPNDHDFSGL